MSNTKPPSAGAMERAKGLLIQSGRGSTDDPHTVVARLLDELDREKRICRAAIRALSDDVCERHDSADGQLDPPDEEECWQCIIEKRDRELDAVTKERDRYRAALAEITKLVTLDPVRKAKDIAQQALRTRARLEGE